MFRDQKGFSAIEGLLILVIVGIIGGIGWYVWDSSKKVNKSLDQTSTTKPAARQQELEPKVPEDFTKVTLDKLGLTFAYPKDWGSIVETQHSSAVIYSAGFSATKAPGETYAVSGNGGYNIIIYANSGKQDFTQGGRGGALWDAVGFTKAGGKYLSRSIAIRDNKTSEINYEIENPELVKAVNTEVVLRGYDFFEEPVYEALINLKESSYYGVTIVVSGKNTTHKSQLKQVAATVQVK